jgi:hypothetical protein
MISDSWQVSMGVLWSLSGSVSIFVSGVGLVLLLLLE